MTRLRTRAEERGTNAAERFATENQLAQATGRLLAIAENYPALKSDATIIETQRSWSETEAQITAARRFYNAAVTDLNNAVHVFPGSLLASVAGIQAMHYFETPPETRAAPDVDLLLQR